MPIFNLECPKCGEHVRKVLPYLSHPKPCPKCETVMVRCGDGPTSRIVEVRDNGIMPKKVEQLAGIEDLVKDRSTKPQ